MQLILLCKISCIHGGFSIFFFKHDWPRREAPDVDVAVDGVVAQGVVPESADQGLGLAEIVHTERDAGTQQRHANPEYTDAVKIKI